MNPLTLGGVAGIGAGAVLLFLTHLAPRFGAGNFVRDADRLRLFGRSYSHREAHLLGVVVHLILSFFFGTVFAFGVQTGVVEGYGFVSLAAYSLVLTIFMGGVVLPLEGHGLFGTREDSWFPVDLLLTNIGWVMLYGLVMVTWGS
jgi:hypothetical protein